MAPAEVPATFTHSRIPSSCSRGCERAGEGDPLDAAALEDAVGAAALADLDVDGCVVVEAGLPELRPSARPGLGHVLAVQHRLEDQQAGDRGAGDGERRDQHRGRRLLLDEQRDAPTR